MAQKEVDRFLGEITVKGEPDPLVAQNIQGNMNVQGYQTHSPKYFYAVSHWTTLLLQALSLA